MKHLLLVSLVLFFLKTIVSGEEIYRDVFEPGTYVCSQCNNELFSSESKYQHSSPWPAFTHTIRYDSVSKRPDGPMAFKVSCSNCGNELGHEFVNDGPRSGQSRFQIYSAKIKFVPTESEP